MTECEQGGLVFNDSLGGCSPSGHGTKVGTPGEFLGLIVLPWAATAGITGAIYLGEGDWVEDRNQGFIFAGANLNWPAVDLVHPCLFVSWLDIELVFKETWTWLFR